MAIEIVKCFMIYVSQQDPTFFDDPDRQSGMDPLSATRYEIPRTCGVAKTAMDQGLLGRQPQPVVAEGFRAKAEADFSAAGSRGDDNCIIGFLLDHPAGDVQRTHRFAEGTGQ